MHRSVIIAAVFAAVIAPTVLAACGAAPGSSVAPAVELTGDWQLASGTVDGVEFLVLKDAPITFTVKGREITGRSACNHYGAEITVDGDGASRIEMTSMTAMACQDPAMASEAAFHAALPRVRGATREGDRLTLVGPDVELAFDRLAPVPVADLVGTDWVLDSLLSGDVVSSAAGEPATLRLEPTGTFAGSTGCRTFTGRWVLANGGISPTDLGMDGACPPDLADQDGHIWGVLEGFRASVEGDTLTLTGDGGDGLIYRARSRDTSQPG